MGSNNCRYILGRPFHGWRIWACFVASVGGLGTFIVILIKEDVGSTYSHDDQGHSWVTKRSPWGGRTMIEEH